MAATAECDRGPAGARTASPTRLTPAYASAPTTKPNSTRRAVAKAKQHCQGAPPAQPDQDPPNVQERHAVGLACSPEERLAAVETLDDRFRQGKGSRSADGQHKPRRSPESFPGNVPLDQSVQQEKDAGEDPAEGHPFPETVHSVLQYRLCRRRLPVHAVQDDARKHEHQRPKCPLRKHDGHQRGKRSQRNRQCHPPEPRSATHGAAIAAAAIKRR